jgi:hypothetical protein
MNQNILMNNVHYNNQISPNYPQQQFFNNNFGVQNISYHQNYDLGVTFNTTPSVKLENYTPLDMKDFNHQQQQKQPEPQKKENEKDHFDFVNDLMKKKK